MRYFALACDYDNTLAYDGRVDAGTQEALKAWIKSGRKAILVTGRIVEDLLGACPCADLFDGVVAENGAVLYRPATREEKILGLAPPPQFAEKLRACGVQPISTGRVIVATWEPNETAVLDTIRDMGLELQVIFNRGAVMVLPSGVNKASGLLAALESLGISPHNTVGIGDGENDHALLSCCEVGIAVANAVPMLRQKADLVTRADDGQGVAEVIQRFLADDLGDLEDRLSRHHLLLGHRDDGSEVSVPPYGVNVLVAGSSGGGKSTAVTAIMERLAEKQYQFCVIDPEGDYEEFEGAVAVGSPQEMPESDAVVRLLQKPRQNVVVNLIGVSITDRPAQFLDLLGKLKGLRAQAGRPHWMIIDEAHHVLPTQRERTTAGLVERLENTLLVTVDPELVAAAALADVQWLVCAGEKPRETVERFCRAIGVKRPPLGEVTLDRGELLVWRRDTAEPPFRVRLAAGQSERRRHRRKYAQGELPPDKVFYFRSPDGRLNLPAQNLMIFLQIALGVDDETWLHHLRRGDYSRWLRDSIRDPRLADEAAAVESDPALSARESRQRFREMIEGQYTQPAGGVAPVLPEAAAK